MPRAKNNQIDEETGEMFIEWVPWSQQMWVPHGFGTVRADDSAIRLDLAS